MLARVTGHLRHFGLCDFVCKDSTDTFATCMHLQHNPCCGRPIHGEESLKHLDDEFHRGIVVVEQYDAIERRLRRLRRSLLDDYTMLGAIRCSGLRHVKVAPSQNRSASAAHRSLKSNPLAMHRCISGSRALDAVGIERRMELKEISRNKHLRAPTAAPYHVISEGSGELMQLASATAWIDELKSVQGLTRLFADRGAQLVALLLLLALGLDSALILTRALESRRGPAAAEPRRPRRRWSDRAVNPALQLGHHRQRPSVWRRAGAPALARTPPATTMPLILAGVIADNDPAKGVGHHRRERRGREALCGRRGDPRRRAPARGVQRSGAARAQRRPRDADAAAHADGRPEHRTFRCRRWARVQAASRDNASLLAGLVRVQPVFNQGKLTGYRIFPGGKARHQRLYPAGTEAGDLIEAVNGTALDDAARAMEVLQTLSSSATATVTVSRNGQPQEVNLNLANLNIETDSGDNSSGRVPPPAARPAAGDQPLLRPSRRHPNLSITPGVAPAGFGHYERRCARRRRRRPRAPAANATASAGPVLDSQPSHDRKRPLMSDTLTDRPCAAAAAPASRSRSPRWP